MPKKDCKYILELESAIEKAIERTDVYGSTYDKVGNIMKSFFPNGVILKTEDDFRRYSSFVYIIGKLNRYSECLTKGGNKDSAIDLINYAAMLSEVTDDD